MEKANSNCDRYLLLTLERANRIVPRSTSSPYLTNMPLESLPEDLPTILVVDNDTAGEKCRACNPGCPALVPRLKDWNADLLGPRPCLPRETSGPAPTPPYEERERGGR